MPSWDTIFQFVTACILLWVAYKAHTTHLLLNSRLSELLEATKQLARKQGVDEGRNQIASERDNE